MIIKKLSIKSFRNISSFEYEPGPLVNLITGNNGHGKTNLIEAIYLLSCAKSFRVHQHKHLIGWGLENSFIGCALEDNSGDMGLSVLLTPENKQLEVNNLKIKNITDFIGKLISVLFVPNDLYLIKSNPSARREFIDKHIFDLRPGYLENVIHCYKAIKQKQFLLSKNMCDYDEIYSWNNVIAKYSVTVMDYRRWFYQKLEEKLPEIYQKFSNDNCELNIEANSSLEEEKTEGEILTRLQTEINREINQRRCIVGPHRDDIKFLLDGKDAKIFASQGQTRSIVLSLKLCIIELIEEIREEKPVILLDDMSSELDGERNKLFLKALIEKERQIFITTTADSGLYSNLAVVKRLVAEKGTFLVC